MKRQVLSVGVAVLTLAVGTSACSGDDTTTVEVKGDAAAVQAAASSTAGQSFEFDTETTTETGTGTVTSEGSGLRQGESMRMVHELGMPGSDAGFEMVTDGTRQFMRYVGMPEAALKATGLPAGWMELTGGASGANPLANMATVDSFLDALHTESSEATDLGTKDVGGGATVHRYSTRIDLSGAFDVETSNEIMQRTMAAMGEAMSSLEATIDVDEQGRVVRLEYMTKFATGDVTSVMTLHDFGTDEPVEIPEAETTFTLDEFAELVYPSPDPDAEPVDPKDLADRNAFIEAVMDSAGLDREGAECLYDELADRYPDVLVEDADVDEVAMGKAMAAESAICVAGG